VSQSSQSTVALPTPSSNAAASTKAKQPFSVLRLALVLSAAVTAIALLTIIALRWYQSRHQPGSHETSSVSAPPAQTEAQNQSAHHVSEWVSASAARLPDTYPLLLNPRWYRDGQQRARQPQNPLWYPNIFEGGATAAQKQLIDWLAKNDWHFSNTFAIRDFGAEGQTPVAMRALLKDEVLMRIPSTCILHPRTRFLMPHTRFLVDAFNEFYFSPGKSYSVNDLEFALLTLIIVFERNETNSHWAPYLAMLQNPLAPVFYNTSELLLFEDSEVITLRSYYYEGPLKILTDFMNHPEIQPYVSADLIMDEIFWALGNVIQRSFAFGEEGHDSTMLVPMMDMFNHAIDPPLTYGFPSEDQPVIQPMHTPSMMELSVDTPVPAGTKLYVFYSDSSSLDLLVHYGFVLSNNPNDFLKLHLQVPDSLETQFWEAAETDTAQVGHNGEVSSDFVRAVNWLLHSKLGLTIDAYERIAAALLEDLGSFSTTLREDLQLIQKPNMNLAEWSAYAFRIEVKKLINATFEHLLTCIETLEKSKPLPEFSSYKAPVEGDYEVWPLSTISVTLSSEEVAAWKLGKSSETQETQFDGAPIAEADQDEEENAEEEDEEVEEEEEAEEDEEEAEEEAEEGSVAEEEDTDEQETADEEEADDEEEEEEHSS